MKITDIEKIFNKLSLQVRSTSHNYGWLTVNGKKILRVHYSHGRGDLSDKVMHKIRGQLKLSEKDFKNLIACPLTYEGYLEILKRKGLID
ncbi:MAG: hypothetical protein COW04_01560 [Deltaproteobacteria bacterium CG12_big_fil_rev_8_21_14_0_65_43_10]|nr:MAG: hypothetical protein AUK23_08515 [Deltaproteobacteria bacterium CG2_30_43_15]PIQ46543.1 MAG: hypothetical protein COW04_01560 [Deltaproteobacteria bacterium CG12_big_fil_rev_8_21_14_0_65_43_10]PIU86255.1 MAG: hypothetical protein COS67_03450 [Deltaproteobacteria bacterium CG06_land_8_20_14_3_00_44_19]PIX23808.1 MAG: hypothetical protein COZ68_08220 [Deltaproteobacteria bacterium CG_4_8_14_3_um_filter_43_13]PIZ20802.1 MAG: hypothetical protein COY50_02805 [Deltaproteobacteria bacterium C